MSSFMKKTTKRSAAPINLAKTVKADHKKLTKLYRSYKATENYIDALNSNNVSTTALVTGLSATAEGDDYLNRQGRETVGRQLELRYNIEVGAAVATNPCTVRAMVLYWKSSLAGAFPGIATILEAPTNVLSPINGSYRESFNVVYDKLHTCSAVEGHATAVSKKLKTIGKQTYYGTSAATYDRGVYILVLMSDQAANVPTVNWYTRFHFDS